MKKLFLLLSILILSAGRSMAAGGDARVVIITLDGFRWQELFGGADSLLLFNKKYVNNIPSTANEFYRTSREARRTQLMPFIWTQAVREGTIIGNRWKKSAMQVANRHAKSYPGYSELFCGHPDDSRIYDNTKKYNPNINILEVANRTPEYKDKVLAIGSWDRFPFILNESRNRLKVNGGWRKSTSPNPSAVEKVLDDMQDDNPHTWPEVRFDGYAFRYAMEALKTQKPKLLFVGFGETDNFGHDGYYGEYLRAARRTDSFIRRLWEYCQSDPYYKDKTTFIITTDHGRGDSRTNPASWRTHGANVAHSEQTWLVAFGKDIPRRGEMQGGMTYYNKQVAATVAGLLGITFAPEGKDIGRAIIF